ncbi:MAG: DMT family transporter [Sciscionella sp.]
MSSLAVTLVLAAAIAHAAWNFAAKRVIGGAVFVWLYYSVSALLCLPVAVWWLTDHHTHPQWTWLSAALLTAALHVAYGVVLQRGYAVGDMSVVYPVARGSGPLLAALVAITVLRERPTTLGLAGILLVVIGVLVIGAGGGGADPAARKRGVGYGLATGVGIAGYTLWDAYSVTTLGIPPVVYFTLSVVLQSLFLSPQAVANRGQLGPLIRRHWRETLVVAVLSPVAYLMVLYAMRLAPVALVAPARESSIVLGSLLGWLVLHEGHPVRRMTGAVLVLAGVSAIGLS